MAKQGGGGAPQQEGGGSSGNDPMFMMAFCIGVMCLLWFTREYYFPLIFKLKYYELIFASYFIKVDPNLIGNIINAQYNPTALDQTQFFALVTAAGTYINYPIAIISVILGFTAFIKNPTNKFNKSFTMSSFRLQEKVNFPQIIPPSKLDLINTDIHEGPWASASTPMAFAKKNDLLDIIVNPKPNPLLGEIGKIAKLRESRARQVFAMQLGYIWNGPDQLPIHTKALFAVFAAAANQDRKTAIQFLRQFNTALEFNNTPDYTGVEELLAKHKNSKIIKKVEQRHAYVMTVMAGTLEIARSTGVLACADFLWLKTVDRQLWYMLNNVGRRAAFPECAGAIAHWRIESRMQRKLISPMIEEAVKALKLALTEIIYQDEND
ncbi:MAG: type IVB secretion system coupling complex protein DotM/IcmP [Gammaproteobacteria bacterium]|nr:type IVB secretion system coupling complex protein DotM/IcmP [Gammaproteobacteria bacterium]